MSLITIAAKDIMNYIDSKSVLIDLREEKEYREGHIPGAINIVYQGVNETIIDYPKDVVLIFYCDRGNASLLLGRHYSRLGYKVVNVYGGFRAYRGEITVD